jgi:hypothetical protein
VQHGDICCPHHDYVTAGGDLSVSDCTDEATVDHTPTPLLKQLMAHQEE